jgi:hypothetical protein
LTDATKVSAPVGLNPGAPVAAYGHIDDAAVANDGTVHLVVWSNDSCSRSG